MYWISTFFCVVELIIREGTAGKKGISAQGAKYAISQCTFLVSIFLYPGMSVTVTGGVWYCAVVSAKRASRDLTILGFLDAMSFFSLGSVTTLNKHGAT